MNAISIETNPETEYLPEGSTWIQITFTLNPEQYRMLWERADNERRTIPDCVRESVMGFLHEKNVA